jgi:hypothetical protein
MAVADDLAKSIQNEIEACDGFLNRTQALSDLVPAVQERKEEAEAKRASLDAIPSDVLEELAPKLLSLQLADEERLRAGLPQVPLVNVPMVSAAVYSTTGTSTAEAITYIAPYVTSEDSWAPAAVKPFKELAERRSTSKYALERLRRLNPSIEPVYAAAQESFAKAKARMLSPDQAAIQMRDVVRAL